MSFYADRESLTQPGMTLITLTRRKKGLSLVLRQRLGCAARSGASDFKTSVVFSVPEGAGQLFKALSVFALRELDMTKIESRPMRSNPIQLADGAGEAL